MTDLASIFGSLERHTIATSSIPMPAPQPGVSWIWAANGIFKRGVDPQRDICIPVGQAWPAPGLARLVPFVRFQTHRCRIPGLLLRSVLKHARSAGQGSRVLTPIEQQYFLVYQPGVSLPFRVIVPVQDAKRTRVRYTMPSEDRGVVLLDLHSHHGMPAFFSGTDNQDDTGLSVSAVVGDIFGCPSICVRANVYGHHWRMPALSIFDSLPDGLVDTLTDLPEEVPYAVLDA